jgi:Kef-type K+ transport system membrane component KefB
MDFLQVVSALNQNILVDIGFLIILATIIAYFARMLKQPLIPAYIITGLIVGPIGFGLIKDQELIRSIAEFGIAFLLFVVGLEINLKKLKHVGPVASIGGLIQVAATYFIGFYTASWLGFSYFESLIVGLFLAFSSTMIVIKLLSDKNELDTLHGKIALGILIIQDIIVILVMALISTFGSFNISVAAIALAKGLLLFVIAFLAGRFIFPWLFGFAAKTKELLFLSSLAVLFLFAILAHMLEFSIAIGAFLGGIALSNLPYYLDIIGKVNPLKSFFSTIFFVAIGMQLVPFSLSQNLKVLVVLFLIIVFIKPVVIFLTTTLFGYEKRTAFLTGISLGQTSEFSLILVTIPFVFGLISAELFTIVIFLTILTMVLTSYSLEFKNGLYRSFSPILSLFDKIPIHRKKMEYLSKAHAKTVVLVGRHRMGSIFYETLRKMKKSTIVVDNNPDIIKHMINAEESCIYGDINNVEVLDKLNLRKVKVIISTVPGENDNLFLLDYVKKINPKIRVLLTAQHVHEAEKLYEKGADYVIVPHILSGEKVSLIIRKVLKDISYTGKLKDRHSKYLHKLMKED